jgi:putative molybdopterin biosynthesis protein
MKRNVYLDNVPLGEALDRWLALCREEGVSFPIDPEVIATSEAAGRVTAEALFARISSPPFHSSAMDGVAVMASETYGATEARPVEISLGVNAELIDTGDPLPAGSDAVIMVEDLNETGPGVFETTKPASPWQNVRPIGEDVVKTELVLPRGHLIRPVDVGALLNAGLTRVAVRRKPVIAIIPTGTELVEDPDETGPGKVMESNSWVLASFARALGAEPERMGVVTDDLGSIRSALEKALETADAVVINAGTSAGREDYTKSVIDELGRVAVHGVAIRPGKPVVLGVARAKPVIGLPGFPVANWRGAEEFLRPLVTEFLGLPPRPGETVRARLARKVFSTPGFEEFVQVKLGSVGGEIVAVPLPRGSGISMSLVRSDGVIRIPAESEGVPRGDEVSVRLYDPGIDVEGTILAVGSHDISLDLLASRIRQVDPRVSLASANVGSMGGIMAVKEGRAHIAGVHLLDPETGLFNISYILGRLSPDEVFLMHMCERTQGLMVRPGNPRGINSVTDLARDGVSFINRQKGSGTRLLLDYLLSQAGIEPEDIYGYEREMFTHTSVAAAVAGGTADVGLGVLAAARALELEFIPVAGERYELLGLRSLMGTPGYEALLSVMSDPVFRSEVEALGGYDLSHAGELVQLEGK